MNYESNATNTQFTETEPLIADANGLEHSLSKMANTACEQLEQERRIEDKDGELLRQQNAKLVSGLFQLNKASNKAPDFAAVVKEAMSNAGSNISAAASTAKTTTEDLGSKGWSLVRAKASEATTKVQEVDLTEPVIDAKIALLNTAIQASQLAADVGKRGAALTRQVSLKGAEFGHASEEKFYQTTQLISDRSVVVANSFERLIKFGDYAYELVTDVIKRIARKFSGWVEKTWSDAIYSANLQYSVNLAEKERKRRMTSEDESGAILNALAVSSLVKELAPEFYRPTEEPSRAYAFALLEQKEQRSRIVQERLSGDLSSKAQIVANLIKAHQEGTDVEDKDLPELLPASTTEEVIYPDPMQIFEEPRNIAEELAPIQTLHKKIPEATTMTDSPQALRLAM